LWRRKAVGPSPAPEGKKRPDFSIGLVSRKLLKPGLTF
jgi:hypothetical protein